MTSDLWHVTSGLQHVICACFHSLVDLATTLEWAEGEDDFIAFYMGHLANEVSLY